MKKSNYIVCRPERRSSIDRYNGLLDLSNIYMPGIRRSPHSRIAFTLSTFVPWNATCHLLNTSRAVARG